MQSNRTRRYLLIGSIIAILFTAGCFQPAGAGLEATNAGQGAPTFTPPATETPLPTETPPPTDTPFPTLTMQPTETLQPSSTPTVEPTQIILIAVSNTPAGQSLEQGTPIAMLPDQQQDPLVQTATALALIQSGQQPISQQQPTQQPTQQQPVIDPLALTATYIVNQATQQAAIPLTQTAQAALGATATFTPQPTVAGATAAPTALPSGSCVHTVLAGENLFRISLQYNTTVDALAAANNIVNPAMIFVDQQITVPGCGSTTTTTEGTSQSASSGTVHIVQQGETLFQISLQYGVTVNDLAARNNIANINLILIGQEVVIP